ncbi:MAG: YbjN domain-containing protein [Hahellaceae bacterium]|nr:YbjN domain-containing protein [Hahellaceae bacterium]
MAFLHEVDSDLILKWLESLRISHYLCGNCQGIHITELQEMEGVLESRLFLDESCLIFTTELEVCNSALFALQADLLRVNGTYAHLKAFLDTSDNYAVRLILCNTLWTCSGLSAEQLDIFMRALIEAKAEVIQSFQEEGYLTLSADDGNNTAPASALH